MSFKALDYVLDMTKATNGEEITPAEKLVLVVLAHCHNGHRRAAWPSVEKMAVESLTTERNARRILRELERKGVIAVVRPDKQGRGQYTEYSFPAIDGKEDTQAPLPSVKKGDTTAPLFSPKEDGRGTEGGRGASPYKEELGTRNINPSGSAPASPEDPHAITPDQRHRFFVEKFAEMYMKKNRCGRSEVPWGVADASMLKAALKEHPGWTTGFIERCLGFYFESEVNHAESPRYKLLKDKGEALVAYRNGPLDRYGKPLEHAAPSGGGVDAAELAQRSRRRSGAPEVN